MESQTSKNRVDSFFHDDLICKIRFVRVETFLDLCGFRTDCIFLGNMISNIINSFIWNGKKNCDKWASVAGVGAVFGGVGGSLDSRSAAASK